MQKKYKIGLLVTGILLLFGLLNCALYLEYKMKYEASGSTIVVVDNALSVNYEFGQAISLTNDHQTIHFSVTNNSAEKNNYNIELRDVISNASTIKFNLVETSGKLNITQDNFPVQDAYLANFVEIAPNETHYYVFDLYNTSNNNFKATLNIGVEKEIQEYFAATILKNNEVKQAPLTTIGEEAALQDEGLIEISDGQETSYYFRGNVANNYVMLGNALWRIVKINTDGTVKLILDDYSDTQNMQTANNENSLDITMTNVYQSLNDYYEKNLKNYDKYIANTRICVDDTVSNISDGTTYYLGYTRALTDYNPIYSCLGSNYLSKIGLLTVDEALLAGASKNSDNNAYYLYTNGKTTSWWTMTPALRNDNNITYFSIKENGRLMYNDLDSYYRGIRPVINLIKRTIVTGNGTNSDPYIIKE